MILYVYRCKIHKYIYSGVYVFCYMYICIYIKLIYSIMRPMYFAYMYLMYMRTSTWVGSERLERRWRNLGLEPNAMWDWIVLPCIALGWIGLGCIRLYWLGLDWVGLCRMGSDWIQLD